MRNITTVTCVTNKGNLTEFDEKLRNRSKHEIRLCDSSPRDGEGGPKGVNF